jgi:hypothetical protein
VLPSSVAAVWLGAVSVAYPTHLGSLGQAWGIATIFWGPAFAAVALSTLTRTARQRIEAFGLRCVSDHGRCRLGD